MSRVIHSAEWTVSIAVALQEIQNMEQEIWNMEQEVQNMEAFSGVAVSCISSLEKPKSAAKSDPAGKVEAFPQGKASAAGL